MDKRASYFQPTSKKEVLNFIFMFVTSELRNIYEYKRRNTTTTLIPLDGDVALSQLNILLKIEGYKSICRF